MRRAREPEWGEIFHALTNPPFCWTPAQVGALTLAQLAGICQESVQYPSEQAFLSFDARERWKVHLHTVQVMNEVDPFEVLHLDQRPEKAWLAGMTHPEAPRTFLTVEQAKAAVGSWELRED